ncbi:hypothetical protein ACFVTX_18190 [Agromyces sp. NPDC058136]|uniref:hypothetical protein n=1 Tax=Agromyces sp. NPDC058136 TaxID=3346354 RepID=UPI0036DE2435
MAEYSRVGAVRIATYDTTTILFEAEPEVDVVLGHPGKAIADDIISITDAQASQEIGPMGPRRIRDETIEQQLIISIWRAGGREQERVTQERAFEVLGRIENHFRKSDTELGGLVLWCFVTNVLLEGTPPELVGKGRMTQLTVTFTAQARIQTA